MVYAAKPRHTVNYHWHTVENRIQHILKQMHDADCGFDNVISIANGGLVPAAMLVYSYRRQTCKTVTQQSIFAQSYNGEVQGDLELQFPLGIDELNWHNTLIFDDIADTGKTLAAVKERLPLAKVATLITKDESFVDFYGEYNADPNIWYSFPWERTPALNILEA